MKDWLETIENEFPDRAIDISESLQLLRETISSIMDDISAKINEVLSERDFNSFEKYSNLAKETSTHEAKIEEIINLIETENLQIEDETDEGTEQKIIPNYEDYLVDHKVEHTLYEDFTHKRPYAFKINDNQMVEVETWQGMLIKTSEILLALDEKKFLSFENIEEMNGRKIKYFSIIPDGMRNPRKVNDKIYIETNQSANSIGNLKNLHYGAMEIPEEPPGPTREELLLGEIRDILRQERGA